MTTSIRRRSTRRGMMIIVALLIVGLLAMLGASFSFQMNAQIAGISALRDQQQAQLAADSGIDKAIALLREKRTDMDQWHNNPAAFRRILVWAPDKVGGSESLSDQEPVPGRPAWRYSVISYQLQDANSNNVKIRYGLSDEASKINLSVASRAQLLALFDQVKHEDVTSEELADALIDWRDKDSSQQPQGAESEYYASLNPPYKAKNRPLETVEELLMVKGFNGQILYGEDYNRNGYLDANENDGPEGAFPPDDGDGVLARGLLPYVTVYSWDWNLSNDNKRRVDINLQPFKDPSKLPAQIAQELTPQAVDFIAKAQQRGYKFRSVGELLGLEVFEDGSSNYDQAWREYIRQIRQANRVHIDNTSRPAEEGQSGDQEGQGQGEGGEGGQDQQGGQQQGGNQNQAGEGQDQGTSGGRTGQDQQPLDHAPSQNELHPERQQNSDGGNTGDTKTQDGDSNGTGDQQNVENPKKNQPKNKNFERRNQSIRPNTGGNSGSSRRPGRRNPHSPPGAQPGANSGNQTPDQSQEPNPDQSQNGNLGQGNSQDSAEQSGSDQGNTQDQSGSGQTGRYRGRDSGRGNDTGNQPSEPGPHNTGRGRSGGLGRGSGRTGGTTGDNTGNQPGGESSSSGGLIGQEGAGKNQQGEQQGTGGGTGQSGRQGGGGGKKAKGTPIVSPVTPQEMSALMDRLSVTSIPALPGLININTAPLEVLKSIPGLTPEQAENLYARRSQIPGPEKATPGWLVSNGVLDAQTFALISNQITSRSIQFTIDSIGFADHVGTFKRIQAVVEMRGQVSQIKYYRDISSLGMGYPIHDDQRSEGFAFDR